MSAQAVEMREARFEYGLPDGEGASEERSVVGPVTLAIEPGQFVVVTGASGCGKTTLTRMVNGLIPAMYIGERSGEVRVAGISIDEWEMDGLARVVGSVFQNPRSQFFNLDTTSEIAFGCENLGIPRDEIHRRVADAVHELGIADLLDRDLRNLSGGQRQLIALASVYAMGPDILLLDEPTASLDVAAMRRLAEVLARCKQAGKTVIVSEHRLWWVADLADRVVVMAHGAIERDLSADAFAALGPGAHRALGVRAWGRAEVEGARRLSERTASAPCGDACSAPARREGTRASEAPAALEVWGLTLGYGHAPALLADADLALRAGSVVALVGRNGVGKTTFARCIAGLHKERAGTVAFGGVPTRRKDRPRHAFLVMQETGYQLFADSTIHELESALAARDEERGTPPGIDELLERFGLAEVAERHPLSLSGGQRQRLALAAGVAQGADVFVLDEPTSGLDRGNMERVAREISALADEGACVVVITHDYEFLAAACDVAVEVADQSLIGPFPLDAAGRSRVRELMGFGRET